MNNWKVWCFGLMAAIISAAADAVIVTLVAPEVFNLNAGLNKLLTIMALSAIKGAALYLKQSPVPKGCLDVKTAGTTAALVLALLVSQVACSDWERQTYSTLKASQAVVNTARDDYRSGKIRNTTVAYEAINKATAAQTEAVEAFSAYERVKIAGTQKDVALAQEQLAKLVAQLPTIISSVKSLYADVGKGAAAH